MAFAILEGVNMCEISEKIIVFIEVFTAIIVSVGIISSVVFMMWIVGKLITHLDTIDNNYIKQSKSICEVKNER